MRLDVGFQYRVNEVFVVRAGSTDAKLYCRLHRGTVVFVKYWERFLVWVGHHWAEDHYDRAYNKVEDVCALQGLQLSC